MPDMPDMPDTTRKTTGWQQPAKPSKPTCLHIGLLLAAATVQSHEVGHEWVCTCGKVFVVVPGTEQPWRKRLVAQVNP